MALPLWNSKTAHTTPLCLHPNGGVSLGICGSGYSSNTNIFAQTTPHIFNFGCFESQIVTKFLASQDKSLFRILCPPPLQQVFFCPFFQVSTSKACPMCLTVARRSVPDAPDVCPTFACYPKNPRGVHSHFFKIRAPAGK